MHVIEVESYMVNRNHFEYWIQQWKKQNVDLTIIDTKAPYFGFKDEKNIYGISFLNKYHTKEKYNLVLRHFFPKMAFLGKNKFLKRILLQPFHPVLNSLILKNAIKDIESTIKPMDYCILNYAHGSETPYFLDWQKTVLVLHSTISSTWLWWKRNRKNTKNIYTNKNIIAVSNTAKEDFENLNIQVKSLHSVINGVPYDLIKKDMKTPLPKEFQNKKYMVSLSRINAEKQLKEIIESYENSNINMDLVFVGKGEYEKQLSHIISKSHRKDMIHMVGHDTNPFRWLKNAEFLVMYSLHEGGPRTLPEALLCSTPFIASDVGAVKDYATHFPELKPFIVCKDTTSELTVAMQKIEELTPIINLEKALEFDIPRQIEKYINILKKI